MVTVSSSIRDCASTGIENIRKMFKFASAETCNYDCLKLHRIPHGLICHIQIVHCLRSHYSTHLCKGLCWVIHTVFATSIISSANFLGQILTSVEH